MGTPSSTPVGRDLKRYSERLKRDLDRELRQSLFQGIDRTHEILGRILDRLDRLVALKEDDMGAEQTLGDVGRLD